MHKRLLLLTLLAVSTAAYAGPSKATVAGLLKDGKKFDTKAVVVDGKVDRFTARTSKAGNAYFLFKLKDGDKELSVYGQGKLAKEPKNGDTVAVTGKFFVLRKVGDREYKNELDASTSLDKAFGVKISGSKSGK